MKSRTLANAIEIAARSHVKQVGKDGLPFILHPIEVMSQVSSPQQKCIAILHDVIEDTPLTAAQLKVAGIPVPVVDAIELLTRPKGQRYSEYIDNIIESQDIDAMLVKMADLTHNMDLTRIPLPHTEKDFARNTKYMAAYDKIKSALEAFSA